MKKAGRKLLGILLAVSMTIAAALPIQGTAAEIGSSEYEEASGRSESELESPEQKKMADTEDDVTEELTEELAEEDRMLMRESADSGNEIQEERTDDSYDINRPVIEKFELVENGQTLDQTQTVHFNMWMYDADSDINLISVELYCNNSYRSRNLTFEKSGEGNLYTASILCSQLEEGGYSITRIYVEDMKSNYAEWNVWDEYGQYRYQFTRTNKAEEKAVTLSNFQMEKSVQGERETLQAGDSVTYSADAQCENEVITYVSMNIICKDKSLQKNISGAYHAETGKVSAIFPIAELTYPGEWELYAVRIDTSSGKIRMFYPKELEPDAEIAFVVEQDYDETKPVIESIDIGENGRMVQAGDTVEIKVKVQEEHPSDGAGADVSLEESDRTKTEHVNLRYCKETGEYQGIIEITASTYPGKWRLTSLSVSDTYGNYAYLSDYEAEHPDVSWHYNVSPDTYDTVGPVIKRIWLDKNGQSVRAGDRISIEVEAEESNPGYYAQLRFDPVDDSSSSAPIYAYVDYSSGLRKYLGTIEITESTNPVRWELAELAIWDMNGNYTYLSECEEVLAEGPWYFTVDPEGYDAEGPVIEDISIDKNGQWVSAGDTVNISIKVKEKHPSSSGIVYFRPQVTNVSVYESVPLSYNPETQEYTGRISITEDTYPCEWELTGLELWDTLGYSANLSSYRPDWEYTYPWFYKVKSKNTYREDFKNVTFHFYGYAQSEDGSYQPNTLISSETVENVGRRATLNELGVFPEPIDEAPAVWRYEWHDWEIDGDTELLFSSTEDMSCNFYASYDKGCANVNLTYLSEESGVKEIMLPVFVEKETTCQEVVELLELPEDAKTEDFAGFRLRDGYDGSLAVGEMAYLSAEAEYNNCQVIWNTKYPDQNGMEVTEIITKSYPEGTRVSDALAHLDGPREAAGMDWEGWVLTGADAEEILSQPVTSIEAAAVYRGKTTAEVSYSYRGEDGTIVYRDKILLLEGEDLSDSEIQGAATDAFKDAEHFEGLRLSEWTGAIQQGLGKYKKISFQALYQNCVVTLKYPDGSCQYVVTDRGADYQLPLESEKYEDILWEGFGKGETVVIAEDQEFLAADAKLKETAGEEPKAEKLSEDEIAKIIEEVENAGTGAVITVDMKKATVVPKEVLEAIQGKPIDIVLDLGGYRWSIGGDEVFASELTDIDLEVTIGADAVPSQLVASIAEGKPTTQLSLTHNGNFGFRADLILNLGSENSGGTGSLYYYDSEGKLKFMNAGQIGADGTTSLSFSHASDYVVVIDGKPQPDEKGEENAGGGEASGSGNGQTNQPGTANGGGQANQPGAANGSGQTNQSGAANGSGQTETNGGSQSDSGTEGNGRSNASGTNENTAKTVPDNEKEKNSGSSKTGEETISIRKNENNLTADSAQTEKDDADSAKKKSPKTGE